MGARVRLSDQVTKQTCEEENDKTSSRLITPHSQQLIYVYFLTEPEVASGANREKKLEKDTEAEEYTIVPSW